MDLTTLAIVKKLQNKNKSNSNENNNNNNNNNIFVVNFVDNDTSFSVLRADKTRDEIDAAMHDGYIVIGRFIYDQDNLFMACYQDFITYATGTYRLQFNNRTFYLPSYAEPIFWTYSG